MVRLAGLASIFAAALAASGCDRLGFGPQKATSAPNAAASAPAIDPAFLRNQGGVSYAEFAAGEGASYSPEALGLAAADRARFWRGMAHAASGALIEGGGAEALVFRGCAETGCADGASIIAIDTATGAAFVGVSDAGGDDILAPNERVEALLRLNAPNRHWAGFSAEVPAAAAP